MFGSSQTLGFGATSGYGASQDAVSQLESPIKKARQEDKQTCLPATIRLLLDAHRSQVGDLKVHGVEVVNAVLVGAVEKLSRKAAIVEFTLNDGSGRIKVRHYSSGGNDANADKDGLADGRYVSIVGGLRTAPEVHVSALAMRPVTTADEVSYHMIEVAHAALSMKKSQSLPTPARALGLPPSQAEEVASSRPASLAEPVAPAAGPPASAATAAAPVPTASVTPASNRESVLQLLGSEGESRPEGVSLAIMIERLNPMAASVVREVLEQLVADGEAYTTIDEEHFLPL